MKTGLYIQIKKTYGQSKRTFGDKFKKTYPMSEDTTRPKQKKLRLKFHQGSTEGQVWFPRNLYHEFIAISGGYFREAFKTMMGVAAIYP